jgi:hypothetical protein
LTLGIRLSEAGMSVWVWIGVFALSTLLTSWVLFWGGADWLEDNTLAAYLIDFLSASMSSGQIKLFFLIAWVIHLGWFTFGLFFPNSRFF